MAQSNSNGQSSDPYGDSSVGDFFRGLGAFVVQATPTIANAVQGNQNQSAIVYGPNGGTILAGGGLVPLLVVGLLLFVLVRKG